MKSSNRKSYSDDSSVGLGFAIGWRFCTCSSVDLERVQLTGDFGFVAPVLLLVQEAR